MAGSFACSALSPGSNSRVGNAQFRHHLREAGLDVDIEHVNPLQIRAVRIDECVVGNRNDRERCAQRIRAVPDQRQQFSCHRPGRGHLVLVFDIALADAEQPLAKSGKPSLNSRYT